MNRTEPISDERLNALVDDQLDAEERDALLSGIAHDAEATRRLRELQRVQQLIRLAYQDPPRPRAAPTSKGDAGWPRRIAVAALAAGLMGVGLGTGWLAHRLGEAPVSPSFVRAAAFTPQVNKADHVLLHIDTMEPARVATVLSKTEQLLQHARQHHRRVTVEVVANAAGLGVLRRTSPFASEVSRIAAGYDNVAFLACGIAMENALLKEGKPIELLPQATPIPAALDQILERLEHGWLYVRG